MKGQKVVRNIYTLLGTTIVGGVVGAKSQSDSIVMWYMQLVHLGECEMMKFYKRNLLKDVKIYKLDSRRYCDLKKQNMVQFKIAIYKTEGIIDHIHTYVWEPLRVASWGRHVFCEFY